MVTIFIIGAAIVAGIFFGVFMKEHAIILREERAKTRATEIRILDYLKKKERITNNDVEAMLGVSNRTATRYLDRLEKRGEIRQIGDIGRGVYYVRKEL